MVSRITPLNIRGTGESGWTTAEVAAHRDAWLTVFEETGFGPATAIRAVRDGVQADTVISFDVGAHRITGSHVWRCDHPNTIAAPTRASINRVRVFAAMCFHIC